MISFETFLFGMFLISGFTGLVTEAVKLVLNACSRHYNANLLSGIVAACLAIGSSVCYAILMDITFTAKFIVCILLLTFMSWLCAMVGYDKVMQVISYFKSPGKGR